LGAKSTGEIMKIIKQNDVAGWKVFMQNPEAGGKVFKQNYNPGRSLTVYNNTSVDMRFNLPFAASDAWTFGFIHNKKGGNPGASRTVVSSTSLSDYRFLHFGLQEYQNLFINGASRFGNFLNVSLIILTHNGSGVFRSLLNNGTISTYNGTAFALGQIIISRWTDIDSRIHRMFCFNRALADHEIIHLWNKGSLNDFISKIGLIRDYRTNRAEIINDSYVGIEDSSPSQEHYEVTGLPAGTLEEKRDWANANLFVNFL
jgi:hypothetical protein